jgi:hypothetical protein
MTISGKAARTCAEAPSDDHDSREPSGRVFAMKSRSALPAKALLLLAAALSAAGAALQCGQSAATAGSVDASGSSDGSGGTGDDGGPNDSGAAPASDVPTTSPAEGSTDDAGASACTAFGQAECAQMLACTPTDFHEFWFDSVATCVSRMTQRCVDELAAPGTSMTAARLAICAAAIAAQTCGQYETTSAPECIPPGSLGNDAGCEFSSQCQSTLCSIGDGWCGACAARVGVGSACYQRTDLRFSTCQAGLICDGYGLCITPIADGGACQERENQCAPPLVCLPTGCAPPVALGGRCYEQGDCAGEAYCAFGAGTGTCKAVTYAAISTACNIAAAPVCPAGSSCMSPDGGYAVVGTCRPSWPSGHSCVANDDCQPAYKCITGTCQAAPPASACP